MNDHVLYTIIAIVLGLFLLACLIYIAGAPGREAKRRDHPSADAIRLLGYIGLFLGLVPWLIAAVWSMSVPANRRIAGSTTVPTGSVGR
jgi:hypothetical protein